MQDTERSCRGLRRLLTPAGATALLSAAWRHGYLPDVAPPLVSSVRVLRLHPGSRCTMRLELERGGAWVAKWYARPQPRLANLYRMLAEQFCTVGVPVAVPRLIAYFPREHVALQELARGEPLAWWLRAGQPHAARSAARGLAALAAAHLPLPAAYAVRLPLARAVRWADRLSRSTPALEAASAELLAALAAAHLSWPAAPQLIHGDLGAAHVFVGGGGVMLIDWDRAGAGDPAEDAGRLVASLFDLAAREVITAAVLSRAIAEFCAAFALHAPAVAPRLAPHVGLACLRKASRLAAKGTRRQARAAALLAAGLRTLRAAC